jgi:hypothetical protein
MNFVGEADNLVGEVVMLHRFLREKKECLDRITEFYMISI